MSGRARLAFVLGTAGVLGFSLTLPATRAADPAFGGWTVAFGRAVPAALLGAAVLIAKGQRPLPPLRLLPQLAVVVVGVVIGFPLFTSLALESVDSVHGAVITGLIPAATAGWAVLLAGERPRPGYWVALVVGLAAVVGLAVIRGGGHLSGGDLLLLAAVVVCGLGYAEGAALAKTYAGWRVISWALVLALPATVPLSAIAFLTRPAAQVTTSALVGLAYLSAVSMCFAFFAWYEGLARGGVAKIGQLQLAQPVLTIGWSALLLGERIDVATVVAAVVVLIVVIIGRSTNVRQAAPGAASRASAVGGRTDC